MDLWKEVNYNSRFKVLSKKRRTLWSIRETLSHVYSRRQTWICITWPIFSFNLPFTVHKPYPKVSSFTLASFFELFLAARSLFWINLNLTFAVCRKRHSKSFSLGQCIRNSKKVPRNGSQFFWWLAHNLTFGHMFRPGRGGGESLVKRPTWN